MVEEDVGLRDSVVDDPVLVFCVDEGVWLSESVVEDRVLVFCVEVPVTEGDDWDDV